MDSILLKLNYLFVINISSWIKYGDLTGLNPQ